LGYPEIVISLSDAQSTVLESIQALHPRAVPLGEALGLTTSITIRAEEHVPPFDNTAVDGFAVRANDLTGASRETPVTLRVLDTIAAGSHPTTPLGPNEAYRIMTGAMIPPGADAVVMVEDTDGQHNPGANSVAIFTSASLGANIRNAGSDLSQGDELFPAGVTITPSMIGSLASVGLRNVPVFPRPKVGVISTGDELVEAGPLGPGKIRDSNRPSLVATLKVFGVEAVDLGLVRDDANALAEAFSHAAATCDAVLTSGGVSVGDFDLTKVVLDRLSGGTMRWMQIAIRPAKPFAFGLINGTPLFGLPGNPVSALVSFELLAAPALRKMMGRSTLHRETLRARALDRFDDSPDGRTQYSRAIASVEEGGFVVRSAGGQSSHVLSAMAQSNCLVVIPPGQPGLPGDMVSMLPLANLALS
jgi:molybdopterin molybdotransferase